MHMREFFDKSKGRSVDIAEFPFLFAMQIHAGIFGLFFSAGWYFVLFVSYREYWNPLTVGLAITIFVGFCAAISFSSAFLQTIVDRDLRDGTTSDDWDYYARTRMSALLGLFVATCSVLIFATGGTSSPFIPFYIMVFTLALTRCATPHPGKPLLLFFLGGFVLACLGGYFVLPHIVDPRVLNEIRQGHPKDLADFLFAGASMIVPYASSWILETREKQRLRRSSGVA